jgi:hypothetical protein
MKTMLVTYFDIKCIIRFEFDIKCIVHFEFIPQGQTVSQAYYVEIFKRLHEALRRKRPELWLTDWFLHRDIAPTHKALSLKQFLAQKSITKLKHPSCSPGLCPSDFWLYPKNEVYLKGAEIFQDIENIKKKKKSDGTESCSTTLVPKMFPTVAGSIVGLSAQLLKGSTSKVTPLVYRCEACRRIIPLTS